MKKKMTLMASNLHLVKSYVISTLQTQIYTWNSNPGLRTRRLMFLLSISRYMKNPRTPDITIWCFKKKMEGNKMKKCMRNYANPSIV